MTIQRSPFFYVGDKFKLLKQLLPLFPQKINNFYEPFVGGGSVFLNVNANKYFLNDIDKNLIAIHKLLKQNADRPEIFFNRVRAIAEQYGLSRSFSEDVVPAALKKRWRKTYYAKFNRDGYEKLRTRVNQSKNNDPMILYILLIYGFNRMLRFNGGGKFNLPVGNVDFNKNVVNALNSYFEFIKKKKTLFTAQHFVKYFAGKRYQKNDFVYVDPPYLITGSEYNRLWGEVDELRLLNELDKLHLKKVKFALSNVTHYNERRNKHVISWMKKYNVKKISSNYINYHNNTKKEINEVLVINY